MSPQHKEGAIPLSCALQPKMVKPAIVRIILDHVMVALFQTEDRDVDTVPDSDVRVKGLGWFN